MQVLTRRQEEERPENVALMLTPDLVGRLAEEAGLAPLSLVLTRLDASESGPRVALDPQLALYPASMLKTPLALAAYTLVEQGELRLADTHEVTQANMTANDKESPLLPGYASPLDELIDLMLTRSDNVATNMLYDIIGRGRATKIVQEGYGLRGTAFHRKLSGSLPLIHDPEWGGVLMNTHPAADAARLFELIARSQVPFALALRRTLERQEWNNKLNAGLAPGDRFAHKTGDTDEVTHDGGILDTAQGRSYVIVVYTGLQSGDANNARFAPFMNALRPHL